MRSRACCCFSHRAALITGSVLLALVLAMLAGCQGLPANVAKCSVTPTPPTNTSVVPPATEPPPAALCAFGVNDRNSEKQRQRSLPRPHRSERRGAGSDYTVRIYVDGAAVFYTPTSTINQYICMPNGQHTVEMVAEDVAGYIATSSIQLNVVAEDVGATDIQNRTNWVSVLRAHFWLDLRGPCGRSAVQLGSPSIPPHHWIDRLQGSAREENKPTRMICTGLL
jgi:hypothetical protein